MNLDLVVGVVLVLGVMILVHELGHFLVARSFGVRVDVFSVGFGPRLFGWKRGATDYRVSALPLGGYVKMAGQDFGESRTGAPGELVSKPRWQRALVAFAGPAVNLVLPVFLLAGFVFVVGAPHSAFLDRPVEIVGLPATAGGKSPLQVGDRILHVNGVQNPTWEKALKALSQVPPGGVVKVEVENTGTQRSIEIPIRNTEEKERLFGFQPIPAVIGEVEPGAPAYQADLRPDDQVIAVNGQRVQFWEQFVDVVRRSNGQRLTLEVKRKEQVIRTEVVPQKGITERGETVWKIGISVRDETIYRPVGVVEAAQLGTLLTVAQTEQILGVVGKLFTGRVSVRQLQGVVGIARESAEAVRRGPSYVILMMAMISLNLGILNLLPIPILDGGHILLLAVEGVRRRDLSLAFKERFVQVGFVFLLVLFAYVMYNDVSKYFPAR